MGNQQAVSGATATQASTYSPPSKPMPSSFDPAHPTTSDRGSNTGVQTAGSCPTKDDRSTLVATYLSYVNMVATQCFNAITELKIQEEIKNTDEIPWYASVIMSAVAALLTDGLSIGVAAAGGAAGRVISGAASNASAIESTLVADVQKMFSVVSIDAPVSSPSTLPNVVVGKLVDAGSTAAKPPVAHATSRDSEAKQQQQQSLSFLQYLNKQMVLAFKRLIDEPPKKFDDAALAALRDNLDPSLDRNQSTAFVAKFSAVLQEFQSSPVSKIGRRNAWDQKRGHERFELETRVAWLVAKGSGKRLIYVDRAFSGWFQRQNERGSSVADTGRSRAYDSGHNQLSLEQDATWNGPLGERTDRELPLGPDMMIKYVEPEFVELAQEKQRDVWLAEPETFMLDYSYAPPKMIKVAGS